MAMSQHSQQVLESIRKSEVKVPILPKPLPKSKQKKKLKLRREPEEEYF